MNFKWFSVNLVSVASYSIWITGAYTGDEQIDMLSSVV